MNHPKGHHHIMKRHHVLTFILSIPFITGAFAQKNDASAKERVWHAWADSVRQAETQKLLPTEKLSPEMQSGALVLPSSLEPGATMNYYWGEKTSGEERKDTLPTFVYLHGSGPRDSEWEASMSWACRFQDAPSYYFIPQIPNEGKWYRWWQQSKQWAWEWLWKQLVVNGHNPNRIIVFGISEGGYGSQRLAAFYADYLAGAGPMAGGEPLINAPCENLQHVDFSLLTGEKDFMFCRNFYTGLAGTELDSLAKSSGNGYRHRVGLVKDAGHGFNYSPTTPWLRGSVRNPAPKDFVWEDFEMDGVHRKGFYYLKVDKRPCDSLRTRYDVTVGKDNRVDIKIQHVRYVPLMKEKNWGLTLKWKKEYECATGGALTLFLDERLVDMSKKVKVYVNGKKVATKRPIVGERVMKESLNTFADPERIFSGKITFEY